MTNIQRYIAVAVAVAVYTAYAELWLVLHLPASPPHTVGQASNTTTHRTTPHTTLRCTTTRPLEQRPEQVHFFQLLVCCSVTHSTTLIERPPSTSCSPSSYRLHSALTL